MRPFPVFTLLLLSLTSLQAQADGRPLAKFKFVYTTTADNQSFSTEAESLLSGNTVLMPLVLPDQTTWLCGAEPRTDDKTCVFRISAISIPGMVPEKGQASFPLDLVWVQRPLLNNSENVLIRSSAFTLTAFITWPENAPAPATKEEPRPGTRELTPEELRQVISRMEYDHNDRSIGMWGYNPLNTPLREGVVRILIPKTDVSPEVVREYAFDAGAEGLSDFFQSIRATLPVPGTGNPAGKPQDPFAEKPESPAPVITLIRLTTGPR